MIAAVVANLREYWMVHSLLALYTVMLAHHAWTGNRKTKGLADYYVGGRNMGGWVIGLSFFATYASTNSFVGFSGRTYEWGVPWLLFDWDSDGSNDDDPTARITFGIFKGHDALIYTREIY